MTNARNADLASVIHIRAGTPGESEQMDAFLASMPCHVITWTDVYCGLARLGRLACDPAECPRVRTLIVEVDSLAASEMPFFTFAARLFPHAPILVYGAQAGTTRASEACHLGAAGWADKEAIEGLLESSTFRGDKADTPHEEPDSTEEPTRSSLDQRFDPLPSTPIAPPEAEAPRIEVQPNQPDDIDATGDDSGGDDREVNPTRVPWRRYEDVPTRRGPTRVKPSAQESTPSDDRDEATDEPQDARDDSGPLLTDEELQALIGDDISAIAPREPSRRPPSDRSGRGGDE